MWKIKKIKPLLLCACALLLWFLAAVSQSQVGWFSDKVSVRWEEGSGATPQQLSKAIKWHREDGGTPPPLTLWSTHLEQTLSGESDFQTATGTVLEYFGEVSTLLPCSFVNGYWPGDSQGCVVDEGIAYTLWGSNDILGASLNWNGNTWYVRGVMKGMDNLVVFPTSENNDASFTGLLISPSEGMKGTYDAQQLLSQYQLPMGMVTDLGLFGWITRTMTTLPTLLLWGWIILALLKRVWDIRHAMFLLIFSLPFLIVVAMMISWAAGLPWEIPTRFLPTRWSNGDFWSDLGLAVVEGLLTVFRNTPSPWEAIFWAAFYLCAGISVLAVLFVWFAAKALPPPTISLIFWGSLFWWGSLFLAFMWKQNDIFLSLPLSLWILPIVWLTSRWLLNCHIRWLNPHHYTEERKEGNH